MRATGIIRRIDDLGRICIPKEIRRKLKITEDDPMEIFIDGENLILKKYLEEDKFFDELMMVCQKYEDRVASDLVKQVQTFIQKIYR